MSAPLDYRNCFLCRVMRGIALGGLGAALVALPARWLGVPREDLVYYALFGAIALTALLTRPTARDEEKHRKL
jgi:hypothetical protein